MPDNDSRHRQLYMTQSSVSKHIAALERELGIALFHRQGRGAEPTDFCLQFSAEARGILRLYESALRRAKTAARSGETKVLISSIPRAVLRGPFSSTGSL